MKCVYCGEQIGFSEYTSPIAGDMHCSMDCVEKHEEEIKESRKK